MREAKPAPRESPSVEVQSGVSVRGWVGVVLDSRKFWAAYLATQAFEAFFIKTGAAQLHHENSIY